MTSEIVEIDEDVTEDTTWEAGTYRVTPFNFNVEGATLTIEPCSTIHVDMKIQIESGGNIVAVGEPDCPITFTSAEEEPLAGDWRFLNITASADNENVFEHPSPLIWLGALFHVWRPAAWSPGPRRRSL